MFISVRSCDREPEIGGAEPVSEAVPPVTETDSISPADTYVDVGGHHLWVQTRGTGEHTVVIEPGIGDTGRIWAPVVDAVAEDNRVVLYHRAGYGRSEPGPMPRTSSQVASELNALLDDLQHAEPPYIVVGHSIGAINALVFAYEHPNQVEGLVLLDPPPVDFIRGRRYPELKAKADSMTAGFRASARRSRDAGDENLAIQQETIASEHEEMFRSGGTAVAAIHSLGAIPLVIVNSGVPNPQFEPYAEEFQRFWRDSSEQLTSLSVRSEYIYAEHSTHDLPGDATDTVVEAIRRAIALSEAPLDPMDYDELDK